jgi:uncharacterized repeat protein (TIGR03803 family)
MTYFRNRQYIALLFLLAAIWFGVRPAAAETDTILHSFGDGSVANDGTGPLAGLIEASDGNFYGTTEYGGSALDGAIYRVTPAGVVTIIHSFNDGTVANDGLYPEAALIEGSDGNFYGTTSAGGVGDGTLFRMSASGQVTILHSFRDGSTEDDGSFPVGALIQASNGNFYGTTVSGGSTEESGGNGGLGFGTAFEMSPSGTVTILHSFGDGSVPNDGSQPLCALIQAADGNLYGTTELGGSANAGAVFRLSLTGSVKILHSFADGSVRNDGADPFDGLTEANNGDFYGTTVNGGSAGQGTVFKMTSAGSITILHSFFDGSVKSDGTDPVAELIQATDGNFYGTTFYGGANGPVANSGTVFEMTPSGSVTILHSFGDGTVPNDGVEPHGALVQASDGNFYSTTDDGGSSGDGTVFKLTGPPETEYNAVQAFEPGWVGSKNPNGVWTYAWSDALTGPFNLLSAHTAGSDSPTEQSLCDPANDFGSSPAVSYSATAFNDGNIDVPAKTLWATGGGIGLDSYADIIFTAPKSDDYLLNAKFTGVQYGDDANVSISTGSETLLDASINGLGAMAPYNSILALAKGQQVVFAFAQVGGSGGDFPANVGLKATLKAGYNAPISISLSPTKVISGSFSTATVTLEYPAGGNGFIVGIKSSDPTIATVPGDAIAVAAGSTSVTFTIDAASVASPSSATISASANGATTNARLTVEPPQIESLNLKPGSVVGGNGPIGTVTLATTNAVATTVALSSNNSAASVPTSVSVMAGQTTATFTIATTPVVENTDAEIKASCGGATKSAEIVVKAPVIAAITLKPSTVVGGNTSIATLTLSGTAAAPTTIALSSNSTVASVPVSAAVGAGYNATSFTINTIAVSTTTVATIQASVGNVTKTAKLTVKASGGSGDPLVVTNTGDSAAAGSGSLRAAIAYANANPGSTITFEAGLSGTIVIGSALPAISASMTIQGPATKPIAVDGADLYQPFNVVTSSADPPVTISNLTIQNGRHPQLPGGGGIYIGSGSSVSLTNCTFSGNSALLSGIMEGFGGAIFNDGAVDLTNCTLSANSANGGSAIDNGGTATLTNCTLSAERAIRLAASPTARPTISTSSRTTMAARARPPAERELF